MFSFRSILLAAAAFATVASAVPTPDTTTGAGGLGNLITGATAVGGLASGVTGGGSPLAGGVGRGEQHYYPDAFDSCHKKLIPVVKRLRQFHSSIIIRSFVLIAFC